MLLALALTLVACEDKAPAPSAAPPKSVAEKAARPRRPPRPRSPSARLPRTTRRPPASPRARRITRRSSPRSAAGELLDVVGSPGGAYTVFAPTDAAFDKLPKGTVEGLSKPEKKGDLRAILQHHVCVPVKQVSYLHDGETLSMADGTKVTIHVKDGKVKVDDANVIATVQASNGVVHVVDAVVLPGAK